MVLRLEVLALQKYIELIKNLVLTEECEIQKKISTATVQKICSNFGKEKGLAANVVSVIYSYSKAVLHWETMRKILENSLHHFEVLEQKYCPLEKGNAGALKETTVNLKEKEIRLITEERRCETYLSLSPKCNRYKYVLAKFMNQMLAGGNETVNPAEEVLRSLCLSNIDKVCAVIDSHAKKILSNCNASRTPVLKNEMLKTIEELESMTTEMKSIQVIHMTIKKYMDTGPYKTWEEVQIEFLQHLIQQPLLHLYANQLSESMICLVVEKVLQSTSSKRQMMIEACLHPAITKLNANKIPVDILLKLLPKFKDLNTLIIKTRITKSQIVTKDAKVFACICQYCSKLKSLGITFQSCPDLAGKSLMPLDVALACLPATLISLSFDNIRRELNVKFLDKMASAEKFSSLQRLTLSEVNSNYPLHKGFRNLVAVAVLYTQFRGSDLFRNVGGQLKELRLTCVVNIEIRILAEYCPSLEILLLNCCSFFSSFHIEPVPIFSSLKEILFLAPTYLIRQESTTKHVCIWCILQNSPEIEKLVVVVSFVKFKTCFQKFVKTSQMRHLQEFELYKQDKNILKGLINIDLAVEMINKFPTLNFIGGIEHAVTQRKLSEIYSNKTFVCIHEKTLQYVLEQRSVMEIFWDDSDDSDLDDIF